MYYRAGKKEVVNFIEKHKEDLFLIPTIVIAEFLSYPLIDEETILKFEALLKELIIVNLDETIAKKAANLRRKYKIKLYDAIVAASCIVTKSTLLTYNLKDFKKIKELDLIKPE
ncbi:MAG: PIN domain-containing protein [Minisyncoccia bacterium]